MAMKLRIVVPPHPLIAHWLTMLRNTETPSPLYATGLEELGKWLTYEALRDWLPHRTEEIETETSKTTGTVIESSVSLLSVPISAAGLHIWLGGRKVLPNSQLCINAIPEVIEKNTGILIFIGQISDGLDLKNVLEDLMSKKVETKRIRVVSALACSKGLTEIGKSAPELNIYCACIDPDLSNQGAIIPGIGNPILKLSTIMNSPD